MVMVVPAKPYSCRVVGVLSEESYQKAAVAAWMREVVALEQDFCCGKPAS